jgi:hypothetical protein
MNDEAMEILSEEDDPDFIRIFVEVTIFSFLDTVRASGLAYPISLDVAGANGPFVVGVIPNAEEDISFGEECSVLPAFPFSFTATDRFGRKINYKLEQPSPVTDGQAN